MNLRNLVTDYITMIVLLLVALALFALCSR
jgi:hypothetical protein